MTVPQILPEGDAAFERSHQLPGHVRRAVWALLACRTARLSGHVHACPEGHVERVWDNSCRHRLCPPCAWFQDERWLAIQKVRLLACDHYHVIVTMPAELRGLRLANVRAMTNLWCATAHATLDELRGDAKYLGACPGLIAARHTWSQSLCGRRLSTVWSLEVGARTRGMEPRAPWLSAAGTRGDGGLSGPSARGHRCRRPSRDAHAAGRDASAALSHLAQHTTPPAMAPAHPRAVSAWHRGAHLSGARHPCGAAGQSAVGREHTGGGHLPLPNQQGYVRPQAAEPAALVPGGVHPAFSLACAGAWDDGADILALLGRRGARPVPVPARHWHADSARDAAHLAPR